MFHVSISSFLVQLRMQRACAVPPLLRRQLGAWCYLVGDTRACSSMLMLYFVCSDCKHLVLFVLSLLLSEVQKMWACSDSSF